MAYVGKPFKHDVFVSYSHGDIDGAGDSKLKQWSLAFVRELKSELMALPGLGRDLSVFMDQSQHPQQGLDPMAPLRDQLRNEIEHSAILTVLMSPQYLGSKWCYEELQWWHANQVAPRLPVGSRTAVARIWPTDKTWPTELCDQNGEQLLGFTFYDKAQAKMRPQPFEWPEPGPDCKGPFRDTLLDLVARIKFHLDEVKKKIEDRLRREAEATRLTAIDGQVVYLHGRMDQKEVWEKTGEELSASGLTVFPGEPDPIDQDPARLQEIRRSRVNTLGGCDALLLLGTENGRALDADLVVVGRQDRQSARALSNHLLPCALLNKGGQLIATPQRKSAAQSLQVEWIDATQQPWTDNVQHWLARAGERLEEATRADGRKK